MFMGTVNITLLGVFDTECIVMLNSHSSFAMAYDVIYSQQ